MYSIEFKNISKSFGKTSVIKNIDLSIRKGERLILLGPSGCGKSTILRMISGLETPSSGDLYLNGKLSNYVDSGDRGIAMVFQNYALYPHMTITENIDYGLRMNKVDKKEISNRVSSAVDMLGLLGLEERYPRELSGGQRQRVSLARAIVKRSDFFLLDEPLSNLDAQLRGQARKELVKIHELYGQTFVYVTHDQIEAMTMGQRIALLNKGIIQMIDTPYNVYHHPINIFTAQFIGSPSMNIIDIAINNGKIEVDSTKLEVSPLWLPIIEVSKAKNYKLGMRPEDITLSRDNEQGSIPVEVKYIEDYGNHIGVYFELNGQELIAILSENSFKVGEKCYWKFDFKKMHLFDADTADSIGYPEVLIKK